MRRISSDGHHFVQLTLSARALKQRLICFVFCWKASDFNMFLCNGTATVLLHSRLGRIVVLQNWPQIKWRPSKFPADAEYPSTETTTYIVVWRKLVFYMLPNEMKKISTPQMHHISSDGLQKLQLTLSARALKQRLICSVFCWRASNFNMFLYNGTATVLLHGRLGRIAILQNWPQIKWRASNF